MNIIAACCGGNQRKSRTCCAPLLTPSCFCTLVICVSPGELDKEIVLHLSRVWVFCSSCCFAIFPRSKINAHQVTETSYRLIFLYGQKSAFLKKRKKKKGLGTEIKKWISLNIPLNLHLHQMQLALKKLNLVQENWNKKINWYL